MKALYTRRFLFSPRRINNDFNETSVVYCKEVITMKRQYRVNLMVNCGGNYFDALDFQNKVLSIGMVEHDDIDILPPLKHIDGSYVGGKRTYTVFITTTSDVKKKLIKYFKMKKDLCYNGTPMRDGYTIV